MQYYRLYDLTNQYPSIGNYITRTPGIVNFYGLYPETNINPIPIKNLDGIKYVSGCTFRFIANIKEKDSDTFGKLYTSEKYFKDLEASITESNPYFTNQSLQDIFIVDISLERFKILFNSLTDKENIAGVDVFFNNFVQKGNKINYEYFVKFLNWVVSLPSLSEIDTNGVIPANQLLAFETYEIDQEKAYFYPNEIQRPGNKGNQQSGTGNSTTNTTTIPPPTEADRTKIQNELNEVNSTIKQIEEQLRTGKFTNTNLFRTLGMVSFFPLGLLLLIGNKRRKEEAKQKLEEKLNEYKIKKAELENKLNLSPTSTSSNSPTNTQPRQGGGFLSLLRDRLQNQK